jgi:mono/diheme cytochrome c family protein
MKVPALHVGAAWLALVLLFPAACRRTASQGAVGQQAPPPAARHDEHVFAGGAVPPGTAVRNPFRGDRASARQGEQLFSVMNCDGCHGSGAVGWVGPSLADGRWRFGGGDGAIFESIYYGRPHGMPAYGGLLLSADAVWKLVTYLQSLPPPVDVPTEAWK